MTRSDPFDELAAMFMTEDDTRTSTDGAADPGATLEVLLVGHLPVRAALWLTPFADAVARDAGTTALVRLDGDEPLVQVLRGQDHGPINASRNLRETVLDIGPRVDAWIVRPSLQTTVPALMRAASGLAVSGESPVRFTILSSADQAAVVNAYRLVKDLVETAARDEVEAPEIGLAVIGTDEDTAHAVAERLSRTTLECLGVDVPLVRCLPQIDSAIRGSALRTFPGRARPGLEDVLGWIEEARQRHGAAVGPEVSARHQPSPVAHDATTDVPDFQDTPVEIEPEPVQPRRGHVPPVPTAPIGVGGAGVEGMAMEPHGPGQRGEDTEAQPTEAQPTDAEPTAAQPIEAPFIEIPSRRAAVETHLPGGVEAIPGLRSAGSIRLEPKVDRARGHAPAAEPKRPGVPREPDHAGAPVALASYVEGLEAIAPRCPGHERIELAVDGSGRLHLLCRDEALRELHAVAAWTRAHRELLAMACPNRAFEPTGRAVQHVFTDAPLRVADLHASNLHLHLLAPVVVDGKVGWYSTPLNAPTDI